MDSGEKFCYELNLAGWINWRSLTRGLLRDLDTSEARHKLNVPAFILHVIDMRVVKAEILNDDWRND